MIYVNVYLLFVISNSPDMICRDHDLSIYTANFNESGHGPSDTRDSLIWEGHGLLTWIMDQREDIPLHGKRTQNYVEVFIELQSVCESPCKLMLK